MKLLRIEPKANDTVSLIFDEGAPLKAPASVVADAGLYAGLPLDEAEYETLTGTIRAASAKARAVRIVSATNISRRGLQQRLVQKGEDPEDAARAAEWLASLGAVDDRALAARVARQAAAKGYGASRIRQELYKKGIPKEYWDEAMTDLPEPDESIDRFLAQRLRGDWPDERLLKKTTDALYRRGHSWSDIKSALERYRQTLEEETQ